MQQNKTSNTCYNRYNIRSTQALQDITQYQTTSTALANINNKLTWNHPSRTQYSETISELARVGTSVLRVLATSKDDGQNAEISYSLVAGNEHKRFRIDSKSGVISIVQPLDYEGKIKFR